MKLRPVHYAAILVCIGLIAAGENLYVRFVTVPPQAIATCFSTSSTSFPTLQPCLANEIRRSLFTHSTADLLAYIIASTSPAIVTQNCHEIAHVIGEETYAKAGNLPAALNQCNASCNGGCVHGAVAASVAATFGSQTLTPQLVQSHIAAVKQMGVTYCAEGRELCHAMGHIFFIGMQNFPSALQACNAVASAGLQETCYEGVFMEASGELIGSGASLATATSSESMPGMDMSGLDSAMDGMDPGQAMSLASGATSFAASVAASTTLDYSFPCGDMASAFLRACFLYWPSFQHFLFTKNNVPQSEWFAISSNACRAFTGSTEESCFKGLGFMLDRSVDSLGNAIHNGASLCSTLAGEGQEGCYIGLEFRYTSDGQYQPVDAICGALYSGSMQNLCYDFFFQTLIAQERFSDAQVAALCNSFPDAAQCNTAFAKYQSVEQTLPDYYAQGL